jgi:hypothetical protein
MMTPHYIILYSLVEETKEGNNMKIHPSEESAKGAE